MQFIVKVQVPLASNHPEPEALIYNQDRSLMQQFPMSKALRQLMKGYDKRYFHAGFDKGTLTIGKPTKAQDW